MKSTITIGAIIVLLAAPAGWAVERHRQAADAVSPGPAPATTNNDDDCSISVAPAATLLLPYFEVDFTSPQGERVTTLFTITNVTNLPQIAHVTIWSDWSFPLLDFNLFLTGYAVQGINMYDIIGGGVIGSEIGVTNGAGEGPFSMPNDSNPNFNATAGDACNILPGFIPDQLLADVRTGLTTGLYSSCGSSRIGGVHTNAVGYVTIDVSSTCSSTLPTTSSYFTGEILFDNVLIGDYEQVNPNAAIGNFAGGNPLVHIRATPEGGTAGSVPGTNLPFTFYDRYTNQAVGFPRTIDRRQPLPGVFAARYIQGGTSSFNTNFKIWREGITGAAAACSQYSRNSALAVTDVTRFDEHEFPMTQPNGPIISPAPVITISLPETSAPPTNSLVFPPMVSPTGDVGGWMMLDLNNGGAAVYSGRPSPKRSQNWVIVSQYAEGRYAVDFDAAWLSNGCSP
ncbi:MAG TPA: hypothetical protein VEZ11_05500 [Thermoanaerobaculia bacterium]|nr:hypothetical protein [Thermoanaerobaculia bacterium]